MKIENYDLSLNSSRLFTQKDQETENLQEWGKKKAPRNSPQTTDNNGHRRLKGDLVRISDKARAENLMADSGSGAAPISSDDEQNLDPRMMILKKMIEAFTGKEIKLGKIWDGSVPPSSPPPTPPDQASVADRTDQPPPTQEQKWGMNYTYSNTHYESETTTFSAQGTVQTADGKSISFSLNLLMSREYFSETTVNITAGAPKIDPLVINYSGTAAQLRNSTFQFDLNADGTKDTIHQLGSGSGFLVFDKNGDGTVNDGSELFGPKTGNGFSELAAYDEDKNNWIDENDSIYNKLGVWSGSGAIKSLKTANVGAIFLGNAGTAFDLKNQTNDTLGQIKNTGVYLKENGGVGTVQQVDFTA